MIIGITGVFGSGKSAVLRMAARCGWETLSADELVGSFLRQPRVKKVLREEFGDAFFNDDGEVNRPVLAKKVFSDPGKLRVLESILHPLVREAVAERVAACRRAGRSLAVEVPLLLERGWEDLFDRVLCVTARPEVIERRLLCRGFSRDDIAQRNACQWPLERKAAASDLIIDNSRSLAETEEAAAIIFKSINSQPEKEQ